MLNNFWSLDNMFGLLIGAAIQSLPELTEGQLQ